MAKQGLSGGTEISWRSTPGQIERAFPWEAPFFIEASLQRHRHSPGAMILPVIKYNYFSSNVLCYKWEKNSCSVPFGLTTA
jgi:hypothetical protein